MIEQNNKIFNIDNENQDKKRFEIKQTKVKRVIYRCNISQYIY